MKYKDTLFRSYFSDKRRLLALLNVLLGTDATDPNEIIINTLDGVFFEEGKNDISCIFRNRNLVLLEHQSTVNNNMPLRCLFYATELYKQIIDPIKEKVYRAKVIKLPNPDFFVLYNGSANLPEQQILKLSDAFDSDEINLELIVKLYNVNEGKNQKMLDDCKMLRDYCIFVNRMNHNFKLGMNFNEAVKETINYCLNNDIMPDYLFEHKKELNGMYWFEYDPVAARKAMIEDARDEGFELGIERGIEQGIEQGIERGIEQGIERGIEQGIERGIEQGKLSTIKNLLNVGTPIDFIKKATGLSEKQILKIAEQND